MKRVNTFLLTMLIVSIMLAVTAENAKSGGNVSVKPVEGSKKAEILLVNPQNTRFNIALENKQGNVCYYNESVSGTELYYKVYDFELMRNGEYKLVVDFSDKTIEKEIKVNRSAVALVETKEKDDAIPYFAQKGAKLKVVYDNNENREIKFIVSDNGEAIYESDAFRNINFSRTFDFSRLKSGEYDITLYIGNKPFYYTLNI